MILLLTIVSPARSDMNDPWTEREECVFGMPYIGRAVMPGKKGYVPKILAAALDYEHIDLIHVALPYDRALEQVKDGRIQCTLDIGNAHTWGEMAHSTIAMYDLTATYLRGTDFKGIDSLKGKNVAYLHGFELNRFLPFHITPQLVYDLSSAFHMLERGMADYILGDYNLLKDALRDSGLPSFAYEMTSIKRFEVRPIFSPTLNGKRLRELYDRRIGDMILSGQLGEIMLQEGVDKESVQRVLKANEQK
jgi:ABC-type amino acid transport substrate-binding protein